MTPTSLPAALAATSPVGVMILVTAASVPADIRRDARPGVSWSEVACLPVREGGCRYGCKVYARRQGAVTRYAVLHSTAYGHRA